MINSRKRLGLQYSSFNAAFLIHLTPVYLNKRSTNFAVQLSPAWTKIFQYTLVVKKRNIKFNAHFPFRRKVRSTLQIIALSTGNIKQRINKQNLRLQRQYHTPKESEVNSGVTNLKI